MTDEPIPDSPSRRSIDVVIPAYNEEECLPELARRLAAVFDAESGYVWRAIVVENGSVDRTWEILREIAAQDARFTAVRLSRNFHMDGGLTAGLEYATADAVVFMAADLQDPPEVIPQFVRLWEQGVDNVYGLVTERQGTSALRRFNSQAFYWLANRLTTGRMPRNVSDFRLMDRRLYETLRGLDERNRFMRGLVAWAGFESAGVPVPRPPRHAGDSKAYSLPVLGFAMRAIFAHTYLPLRVITAFGIFASFASTVAFVVLFVIWETQGVPFAGFGSLVSLGLMSFGILTTMLGVMAEYLGLIYEEVKRRPNFVVRETVGLPAPPPRR
ncbi:MAG TPA: glycosyltransferase family 2 protein [Gaiellaceae bacterium]|nr:glycosyltransferase family 2 protein [Gaiellaceae bacterium]